MTELPLGQESPPKPWRDIFRKSSIRPPPSPFQKRLQSNISAKFRYEFSALGCKLFFGFCLRSFTVMKKNSKISSLCLSFAQTALFRDMKNDSALFSTLFGISGHKGGFLVLEMCVGEERLIDFCLDVA